MSDDLIERLLDEDFLSDWRVTDYERQQRMEHERAEAAARIRELEAELAELRGWDDHFRAVCGFKRDGRPSPECLDEYLAALSPAPVSVGEADKPPTPSLPCIVVAPHTSLTPDRTWVAYSPERPDIGRYFADTEEGAKAKAHAALSETEGE